MRSSGDMRNMACSCAGAGWDGVEEGCERILEKQGGTDSGVGVFILKTMANQLFCVSCAPAPPTSSLKSRNSS